VADAYEARQVVEATIVQHVASRHSREQIEALRHHLRKQSDAERRGDKVTLVHLLTDFHLLLASMASNQFLRGFVETLASTTSLAVLLYDQSDTPSHAVAEHRELVQLLEQGDGAAASTLMVRHLGRNQQRQAQSDAR
jgi:DNA-binding GntR family transcriptional regulator